MIKDIFYCPEWLMFVCFCQEGRDMQGKITRVGVGLYLFNDKHQLLLGLRKSSHGCGTWCPPGGHMEFGESNEQAAIREAREETGLEVRPEDV